MKTETLRMTVRNFAPEDAADLYGNWVDLHFFGLQEDWRQDGDQSCKPMQGTMGKSPSAV